MVTTPMHLNGSGARQAWGTRRQGALSAVTTWESHNSLLCSTVFDSTPTSCTTMIYAVAASMLLAAAVPVRPHPARSLPANAIIPSIK